MEGETRTTNVSGSLGPLCGQGKGGQGYERTKFVSCVYTLFLNWVKLSIHFKVGQACSRPYRGPKDAAVFVGCLTSYFRWSHLNLNTWGGSQYVTHFRHLRAEPTSVCQRWCNATSEYVSCPIFDSCANLHFQEGGPLAVWAGQQKVS